ncbi:tetratricopeptide repeat-containing [Desulfonema limicola]|uniref:Tetratricopeptide repeat-containing n=1 Tax=Desulfonema limicola TaxID=45656 RepID=A0A975B6X9_9BACT|nr:hypothetical protein [Desulfonema limicola]QTA79817.1 tetratricopeptide repeat-containing [Desulfonema limicola]
MFKHLLLICCVQIFFYAGIANAHEIHMLDGRVFKSKFVWEEGSQIKYSKFGSTIGVEKKLVDKVIYDDDRKNKKTSSDTKIDAKSEAIKSLCPFQCNRAVRKNIINLDLSSITLREWRKLPTKIKQYNNDIYKLLEIRVHTENLLNSGIFKEKEKQYQIQLNNIIDLLNCYRAGCRIIDEGFKELRTKVFTMESILQKTDYLKFKAVEAKYKIQKKYMDKVTFESDQVKKVDHLFSSRLTEIDFNLITIIESMLGEGNYLKPIGIYTKYILDNRASPDIYIKRGDCYFKLASQSDKGKSPKEYAYNYLDYSDWAIKDYNLAISYGDRTGEALINIGRTMWLIRRENYEIAIRFFDSVIKQNMPMTPKAYFEKAIAYNWNEPGEKANMNMKKSAELGYEKAVEMIEENLYWGIR